VKYRRVLCLLCAILFALGGCEVGTSAEKEIVEVSTSLPTYSFEEACDSAAKIVIGTVRAVERTYEESIDGTMRGYTVLKIKVEETLKGKHKRTISYTQTGGETEDTIYTSRDPALAVGDKALIFMDENGFMLSSAYLRLVDENDNISTYRYPSYVEREAGAGSLINVYDYADLIEEYLACVGKKGHMSVVDTFRTVHFEEACDEAHTIVIGEVVSVPLAREVETVLPNGEVRYDNAYTDIRIKVEMTLKGEHKRKITYVQSGGITKDSVYWNHGHELLREGERVLLFLNEEGRLVDLYYVLCIDRDDNIAPYYFHYPEGYAFESKTINVYNYAQLITDYLE